MSTPYASLEKLFLQCHPDTPQDALWNIRVGISRTADRYPLLSFRLLGDISRIAWPVESAKNGEPWHKGHALWEHSCFELFLRIKGEREYLEFNFASSRQWAAYAFDDYRAGSGSPADVDVVVGYWTRHPAVRADLGLRLQLPMAFADKDWEIGLSAVIEELDGAKSYWALAHPPGKPDFHHPTCFARTLPAPDAA